MKMREFISPDIKIDFVSKFKLTAPISALLVLISLVGMFTTMQYGVDFRGGAEVQVKFQNTSSLGDVRNQLEKEGFSGVIVQSIGEPADNELLLKVPGTEADLNTTTQKLESALGKDFPGAEIRKIDIVGPKAGAQLRISGFQAMLWALLAIMVYIGLRFDFKYSPGAIVALFHDVSIVLGVFAFTGTEFTLQTVAALLAVIGYSVNDTVIVYDRVREHEERFTSAPLSEHINNATNETLSRTILTSGTTLFVSIALYIFGGLAIRDFFLAFSIGVVVGTYSSIFVAAPVTLFFDKMKEKSEAAKKGKSFA